MWKQLINNFLECIAPLTVVLSFLVSYRRWKSYFFLWPLFFYFVFSTINLGFATWLAYRNTGNGIFYNIQGIGSLLFLWLFFISLGTERTTKVSVKISGALGIALYLTMFGFWYHDVSFFSPGYSVVSLLIILFCLLFLRQAFSFSFSDLPLSRVVWIVSGLLNYFLSTFLIHITYHLVTKYSMSKVDGLQATLNPGLLWGIHNVIYFLSCIFIGVQVILMANDIKKIQDSSR